MKKRKENRFTRYTKRLMIICAILFFLGVISLNSYESSLNISCEKLEKQISATESDIDGLNMMKQDLTNFARINKIASNKGYNYNQNRTTAIIVGVPRD